MVLNRTSTTASYAFQGLSHAEHSHRNHDFETEVLAFTNEPAGGYVAFASGPSVHSIILRVYWGSDRKRLSISKPNTANAPLSRKSGKKLLTMLQEFHLAINIKFLGHNSLERF